MAGLTERVRPEPRVTGLVRRPEDVVAHLLLVPPRLVSLKLFVRGRDVSARKLGELGLPGREVGAALGHVVSLVGLPDSATRTKGCIQLRVSLYAQGSRSDSLFELVTLVRLDGGLVGLRLALVDVSTLLVNLGDGSVLIELALPRDLPSLALVERLLLRELVAERLTSESLLEAASAELAER